MSQSRKQNIKKMIDAINEEFKLVGVYSMNGSAGFV